MTDTDFVLSRANFRYTIDIPGWTGGPLEVDTAGAGIGTAATGTTRQGTSSNRTQVLGAPATYADIPITLAMSNSRNAWPLYRFLEGKQGKLTITLHRQPLDANEDPFGDSQVSAWTMNEVGISDYDNESGDPAELSLNLTGGSWS